MYVSTENLDFGMPVVQQQTYSKIESPFFWEFMKNALGNYFYIVFMAQFFWVVRFQKEF